MFAGNNIPVTLLAEDAPTPLITYATAKPNAAYGLGFTASHNPPEWNGRRFFAATSRCSLDEETCEIEDAANRLATSDVIKLEADLALAAGVVQRRDFTNEYVDAVERR